MSESAQKVSPLEDARSLIRTAVERDPAPAQKVREALLQMGREGDFGRLGEAAAWLAEWQGRFPPRIESPTLAVFASSHGVQTEGVGGRRSTLEDRWPCYHERTVGGAHDP